MIMGKKKHASFSGSLGFVLASAASAVGIGNIWRFPYLAAKDGGAYYDYSAEAVVRMLSNYLSPKVSALMKEAE